MDMKTFEYLYYRTRGFEKDAIMAETGITDAEYDFLEGSLSGVVASIEADRPKAQSIGGDFVRLTRYVYERQSDQENGIPRPDAIKPRSGEIVALPAIGTLQWPSVSLQTAIAGRRSVRDYADTPFTPEELSWLLWASSWARDFRSNERIEITLRNVPSAGARHPLECFVLVRAVQGIAPGLYYYHPVKHCLIAVNLSSGIADAVYDACMRQEMVKTAAVTIILSAVAYRTSWRYGQRGYRYLYLDAGHVGQNIHLAAEAIGAGACMIGAYQDEAMNDCVDVDGADEFVIYIATVGKKK